MLESACERPLVSAVDGFCSSGRAWEEVASSFKRAS